MNRPRTGSTPHQPAALTVFKTAGVVVSSAMFATLLVRMMLAIVAGTPAWLVLPAFLGGYLAADLLSGTVHWFCDTFFDEHTPVLGKIVIQPFRDHHLHPQRIAHYRFIEQDTTNFFLLLVPLVIAFRLGLPAPGSVAGLLLSSGLAGLCTGSFCTNLFHKWAHARRVPVLVRWLQRGGLILSPDRHRVHHGDYDRGFCVTSGWMNPLLDAVGFFPRLEGLVRRFQRRPGGPGGSA